MCRSRPSGSPSISTTTFRSGCTGHRQRSGAHRPGGMIELSALRPGDQRAVDTAEIARRRACQLSTAPTASSTTRSSSRPSRQRDGSGARTSRALRQCTSAASRSAPRRALHRQGRRPTWASAWTKSSKARCLRCTGTGAPQGGPSPRGADRVSWSRYPAQTGHLSRDDPSTAVGESSRLRGQRTGVVSIR